MAQRRFGSTGGSSGAVVSAAEVLDAANVGRLHELVDLGALVSVSRSRDGGAVAVTVTWDGEWERHWFRSAADAALVLDEVLGLIGELAGAARAAPAAHQDRRKRRQGVR